MATDYNSKYSGEQVEALLDQVASGNAGGGGGGITVETDPIFSASPAAAITEEQIRTWDDTHELVGSIDEDISKLYDALDGKQEILVSGENIKTINGESIVGEGDITIAGGSGEKGDKGDKGDTGVGVQSVAQTTTSNADGGSNVVTVTLTDGTKSTFTVKNGSKGSQGEQGLQGVQGIQGPKGDTGPAGANGTNGTNGKDGVSISSVKQTTTSSADGGSNVVTVTLSNGTTSTFTVKNGSKGSAGSNGTNGANGATFTPSVDANGNLSWTNDKGLANPATVNIKGPKGDSGEGGGGSMVKETILVTGDTIELLQPNKVYLVSLRESVLRINAIEDPDGDYGEYTIINDGGQLGGDDTELAMILPDVPINWANNGEMPVVKANSVWELSIVFFSGVADGGYNAVLTPFGYA